VSLHDSWRGLEPGHDRHGKIHNHNIGLELLDFRNRLSTIAGLTTYLPVGLPLEESAQQQTDGGIVVSDQDFNGHCIYS
jgi:hypothetical protein